MNYDNTPKNILFDSDEENNSIYDQNKLIKTINLQKKVDSDQLWKSKIIKYTILSKDQIDLLESEFIKRRLKFNKSNIRKLSKEIKIPYKRCLNYFLSKIKCTDQELFKNTEEYIKILEKINEDIERIWSEYINK